MNEMRIYVASLSDYNNGRLEGKWLDLSDYSDASELMEAIQEMLDELTEKYKSVDGEFREEFAVHDYEGIPATLASEYMGEQDFQQLYDIAEVADEFNIPVAVLIERAGDTGSDDYQALADSLIMVVDGNDESDIVAEYEDQIGELGFDWWSNYVGITKTDQRLLYGEDVDNFKEEILYENPDMDESEAEGQAEERADDEQEQRNSDLIGYLQERGYEDEFPNWVYKDYQDAWENDLSYEFDVIHHDGEMYVFTNNYSLGGTILSGVIGAYIGYKVGRAKPQKKGFSTEKKIGRNIKNTFSKKKMAEGGNVKRGLTYGKKDDVYFDVVTLLNSKMQKPKGILGQERVKVETMSLDSLLEYLKYYEIREQFEIDLPTELFTKESFPQYATEDSKLRFISGKIYRLGKEELLKKKIDSYTKERGIKPPQRVLAKFEREVQDAPQKTTLVQRIMSRQLLENGGEVEGNYTKYLITEFQSEDNKKLTYEYDSLEDAKAEFYNLIDKTNKEHRATKEFNTYLITLEGYVEGKGYKYISDYEPEDKYNNDDDDYDDDYAEGGSVDEDIQFAVVIKKDDKNYNKIGYSKLTEFITDKQGNEFDKLYFEGKKLPKKYNAEDLNYSVRELDTFTSSTGDRKFILLKELTDDNRIYYYILHYDDKKVYAESYDMNFIKSELKRLTNGKNFYSKAGVNFGEGGEVGKKPTQSQLNKMTAFDLMDAMKNDKQNYGLYKKQLLKLYPEAKGFEKGGGIGFKGLSSKVAKRYEGESVAPKYQSQYGTTYSKSEAKEVGDKVAGKVYWNQQGRKMAKGGGVDSTPSYIKKHRENFAEGGENTRLRTWYTKTYPEDERGKYIDMYNTFADLWNALQNKNNVYNVIVEGDSLIRERLFQKLSQIKGVDYKTIYNLWLEGDEDEDEDGDGIDTFAKGGGVSYNKVWEVIGINQFGKMFKEKITLGRMSDKEDVANALRRRTDLNIREITSIKEVFAKGGMTEHGLMAGDKILGEYSKYSNDVEIADKNNKFVIVDLDKGMRSRTMGDVKKEYLAKGGGVSEFWTEINESTLNERLPYDLGVVNEDEDLISGNIWIKFRKSPMEMPSYELKRAISEDFEYFGYGNQEPPKRVSLMDGSWGSFYIHVENLTLNEIMTLLLELPEQVQIRLEERKIKGYKDLGLDTYGQSLDLRISQSSDDDDYEYANGGMVDYSVWTDFDKEALKSKNGSYLMSEKEALKMAKEYKKMFPTNEITIRKGEIITEYDFNSKIFKKYAVGGGVDNKKEWIAIYSRGNGQQIVVVKAKDKSEAYREAEMSRGNYKLGSDWQMIDIYESQYAKGGGISGLDDLLRG